MFVERTTTATPFLNYTQLDPLLPLWAWQALRFASIGAMRGLAALLWFRPALGQPVPWRS